MQPVALFDRLILERAGCGLNFTCDDPTLPTDDSNLVVKAARAFLQVTGDQSGVRIHLEKRIPSAAGLGGGSGNAATTLAGLNRLFDQPLPKEELHRLAATLGSDVPFFLYGRPALATGRGEAVTLLEPFPALENFWLLLVKPGFGISTAWAYRELAKYPEALSGAPGRAAELVDALERQDRARAWAAMFNSLEAPALSKYPVLGLYKEFLESEGALRALMSGSGSTTFAVVDGEQQCQSLRKRFLGRFGGECWTAVVALGAAAT